MKTSSKVFARMLDTALLAGLVLGNADVRVFAFWMVSIMVVMMFLGLLVMTPELAEKLQGRSFINKAFGILVHALYAAALIYAGFPILAALYATAASVIRISAEAKLAPQVKP
ncbi:hypothetical protein HBO37_29055 [Pseudomonas proteolytica]|uniref:hypothetical protein n=1 Tax=Pseudomonas proteolytica TaxID=219574 RepID=UPI001473159E|nr:hypothetical protein [Pseudomonas proteolytica]NMZ09389.1 hypothetical protein [Pseudomonas proteolytica]